MRVKRYVSTNIQDAMVKVKSDLGKNAVILHTRKFREGGFLGFFGKQMVEVTAAIEDLPSVNFAQTMPPVANHVPVFANPEPIQPLKSLTFPIRDDFEDSEEISELQEEILEMKTMMSEMMGQIENVNDIHTLPKPLFKLYQTMINNEVDEKIAKRLLRNLLKKISHDDLNNQEKLRDELEKLVLKILKTPKPISFKKVNNQQSIVLVGPTGVGKTTTIAKLAASFHLVDQKKVALITADTYRIAAVEQLKTFGEIIGVPVDVVYTPQELKAAITRQADKDLVLIDTAGRSHKNVGQMTELKSFLEVAELDEIFLVLSATTKYNDMIDIVSSYADIMLSKLIFTKLDETTSCGAILNLINKTKKLLSYVTIGQNVPDDIEIADPAKIAKMITRER